MTEEEIKERLAVIKDCAATDEEKAHILEDKLFTDFIEFVADELGDDLGDLAHLVLSSREIDFARCFA